MGFQPRIHIHADDYGMISQSNERIHSCWEHGCIDGVSVMVNGRQPAMMGGAFHDSCGPSSESCVRKTAFGSGEDSAAGQTGWLFRTRVF